MYIGESGTSRNAAPSSRCLISSSLVRRLSLCAGLLIVVGGLAGCAVSMPMASLMPDKHDDDQTASIIKPKLAEWVGHDDWKSAAPAFSQALEEKGSSAASWDNPKTGAKGSFMAVGDSFPGVVGRCRAFHASLDHPKTDKGLDGTACADKTGEWQVTEMKPEKKG